MRRWIYLLSGVIAALALLSTPLAWLITDWMWFTSVEQEAVFVKTTTTQAGLLLGVGAVAAAFLFANALYALRRLLGTRLVFLFLCTFLERLFPLLNGLGGRRGGGEGLFPENVMALTFPQGTIEQLHAEHDGAFLREGRNG